MSQHALADEFPREPITLIIPYGPGGNVDVAARIIADPLSELLGEPVIVENRPGAGGMIAGNYVAESAPDGHTLFVGSTGPVVVASLTFPDPLYHWQEVFTPISSLAFTPAVLVTREGFAAESVEELFEFARTERVSLSTGGAGSINHLSSELLQEMGNVEWEQVHYQGNVAGMTDLIGGHVDIAITQLPDALEHIRSGQAKPLAVLGHDRVDVLPDVPSFDETDFGSIDARAFIGVLAPIDTPRATIDILHENIAEVLSRDEVIDQFAERGVLAEAMSPEEFRDFLQGQTDTWKPVVEAADIRAD